MSKLGWMAVVLVCCVALWPLASSGGEFRFPVRIAYPSTFQEVISWHDDLPGTEVSTLSPVGLALCPYYQFDSGLAVRASVGPVCLIMGDLSYTEVPVGVDVMYAILPTRLQVCPYVFAGVRYHILSGDYVDSSSVGAIGGGGLEILRQKVVAINLEVAYDSAPITLGEGTGIEEEIAGGVVVSIGAVF